MTYLSDRCRAPRLLPTSWQPQKYLAASLALVACFADPGHASKVQELLYGPSLTDPVNAHVGLCLVGRKASLQRDQRFDALKRFLPEPLPLALEPFVVAVAVLLRSVVVVGNDTCGGVDIIPAAY